MCCCTLSIFAIIVLVGMGFLVQSGDPYIGGHKLVATEEVRNQSPTPEAALVTRDAETGHSQSSRIDISIGRGPQSCWVEVRLVSGARVKAPQHLNSGASPYERRFPATLLTRCDWAGVGRTGRSVQPHASVRRGVTRSPWCSRAAAGSVPPRPSTLHHATPPNNFGGL